MAKGRRMAELRLTGRPASTGLAAGPVALLSDSTVMGIYGPRAQEALGARLQTTHELPAGEGAKQALRIAMPWPSPTPKAPLFVWLRGETEGRATKVQP